MTQKRSGISDYTSHPILEVQSLSKRYKGVTAVDQLSFSIEKGSCFGLLGPNGAGKTTTIEMIEGICKPSDGQILYKNKPRSRAFRMEIGIQFQSTALMDFLTVREALSLFGGMYSKQTPIDKLISDCQLSEFIDQQAAKLSGGQRQRLLLAIALINDPEIVFLDEPTTGLDPQSRHRFWELVEGIKAEGKTIILTTHYMDEAESLCDHLIIIDHGKIIHEGSPQTLLSQNFDHAFVTIDHEAFENSEHALTLFPNGNLEQDSKFTIVTDSVESTIKTLIQNNISLQTLYVRKPTLDDLFLKLTGHKLRE